SKIAASKIAAFKVTATGTGTRYLASRDTPEDHPWGSSSALPGLRRSREARYRIPVPPRRRRCLWAPSLQHRSSVIAVASIVRPPDIPDDNRQVDLTIGA